MAVSKNRVPWQREAWFLWSKTGEDLRWSKVSSSVLLSASEAAKQWRQDTLWGERKGFNTWFPTSAWFHSPPVSLLAQASPCSAQCWRGAADMKVKHQTAALLLPARLAVSRCLFPPMVGMRVCGKCSPLGQGGHCEGQPYSKQPFLHSWPTWEGCVCTLNLGGVFFIIPESRGIFIITAKLNSLLIKRERRISRPCGKWMVNTTGSC